MDRERLAAEMARGEEARGLLAHPLLVAALKAVLVILPLELPQVLALVPRLYHLAWFLGVQALASPRSR